MAQKKKKNKSVGRGNAKAKKSTKKANLSSQITENLIQISNGREEATQKFNQSIVNTKKANQIIICNTQNVTNQISNAQKFKLSRCQHKKKKKKNQIYKGKSIVKFDQMEIDQAMRIHFQEEIMTDILSRLPVRTLLRFKCVSKFWKSLIVDPYFKRTHYIQSQNSQKLLIAKNIGIHKDDVFNFYSSSLSKYLVEDEQKLHWPLSCRPKIVKLFCSCHGLVLIIVSSAYKHAELWLWNPSTTESIRLPNPEFLESGIIRCVCGLAYDATCEDFKILAVNLNSGDNFNAPIELLSLKCGSWRRFGYPTGIQRVDGFGDCGMDYLPFLHGAFHWLGKSVSKCYTTVSFNISNEVYGEVQMLESMHDACFVYRDHGVSVLRGMLCYYSTYNYRSESMAGTFNLWVMKDYGVKESWTKLIKIQDTDLFNSARPKYMFPDCEVLLHCKRFGCARSIFTTSRGPFGFCPQCTPVKCGVVYAESFVSPKSFT